MSYPIGIVAVAFGGIDIKEAARRAADLGFEHLDSSAGAIDALDAEELADLAVPIGDRISGFDVRHGLHVDGALRTSRRRPIR